MSEAKEVQNQEAQVQHSSPPEKKFSTGAVSASVWKNETLKKTGEPITYYTVSLQRRYCDKDGNWKSTNSLRINDLPKAILVLNKAYESIVMKSDDSNKDIATVTAAKSSSDSASEIKEEDVY